MSQKEVPAGLTRVESASELAAGACFEQDCPQCGRSHWIILTRRAEMAPDQPPCEFHRGRGDRSCPPAGVWEAMDCGLTLVCVGPALSERRLWRQAYLEAARERVAGLVFYGRRPPDGNL